MVKSDISTQITERKKQAENLLALLNTVVSRIRGLKDRMNADYQRKSENYVKLFQDLDDALKRRIQHLNKPAFDVRESAAKLFVDRTGKDGISGAFLSAAEEPSTKAKIEVAVLRKELQNSLGELFQRLCQEKSYERSMTEVQHLEPISEPKISYVPVMMMAASKLDSSDEFLRADVPDFFSKETKEILRTKVGTDLKDLKSQDSQSERELVDKFFKTESDKWIQTSSPAEAQKNQRILQTMNALYHPNSNTQS